MTPLRDWTGVLGDAQLRHEYARELVELGSTGDEAVASLVCVCDLVALTRDGSCDDDARAYLDDMYLGRSSDKPDRVEPPRLRLPPTLVQPLASLSSSSSTASIQNASTETIRAGLEYLDTHAPPPPNNSPSRTLALPDQVMLLLESDTPFPRPLSPSTRASILTTCRQPETVDAARSVAAILLNHYASVPTANDAPAASARPAPDADQGDSEDDEEVDRRSIQTGIQEARESILRKEQKLEWLLGQNYHKGPSCRHSPAAKHHHHHLSAPTTTLSSAASTSSSSTIRRPASSTPTASRIYHDESTSTVGAMPEFASRSLSDARDSVDSYAPSTIAESSHHRHSRLISTSSSMAPLLASARPSTAFSSRHGRGASTSTPTPIYSLDHFRDPGSPAVPTPPLQPLDSPSSFSRPFAHLQDLPPTTTTTSKKNKRNSLDSARDDLRDGRRASIPLDCQELSGGEKSELVWRSKKLEKLLGSRQALLDGHAAKVSPRRRWRSEDSELTTTTPTAATAAAGRESGEGTFEARRRARPSSITIPSSRSGVVQPEPAQISPTTVLPDDQERRDLSSSGPREARSDDTTLQDGSTTATKNDAPTRPAPLMHRSSSSPTYSTPTSPSLDLDLVALNASSAATSPTSGPSSSTVRSHHHLRPRHAFHRSKHTSLSSSVSSASTTTTPLDALEQARRDERRRKLEKVRRVLGERVPLGLVVHTRPQLYEYDEHDHHWSSTKTTSLVPGERSSAILMTKSKSRQMGERIKDVFKSDFAGTTGSGGGGPGGRKSAAAHLQDRENWVGTQSAPQLGVGGGGGAADKRIGQKNLATLAPLGVEALTKARKLESWFGDLPPQSLYLAPTPAAFTSRRASGGAPPLLKHRRSRSDVGAAPTSRSESFSSSSSSSSTTTSRLGSVDLALCRTRSDSSSAQTYQRSIASLRYVLERDPHALDEVVRAYADNVGGGGEGDEPSTTPAAAAAADGGQVEPDAIGTGSGREGRGCRLASSSFAATDDGSTTTTTTTTGLQQAAAVRKAHKLSSFFGTTRGEVWHRLLDDLETSVEEDADLEDDERQDVLDNLSKLRQGVSSTQSGVQTQQ